MKKKTIFLILSGLLVLIVMFFSRNVFTKDTEEATFWKWFVANQDHLFKFEDDKEKITGEITSHLQTYKKGLVFEVSTEKSGIRELTISADGIRDLFPFVIKLTAAAPKLSKWKVIAFRPRMDNYAKLGLTYDGREFNPGKIWFYSRVQGGEFDVIFYHPDYTDVDRNNIISGTYILLDMALGEYDVVTGIHNLDHQLLPKDPKAEGLRPFSEFRAAFDDFKNKKKPAP